MKYEQKAEVLHETQHIVLGDEPFLKFPRPTMIVNIRDYSGQSHNFIDNLGGVSFNKLKKGDRLSLQWVRVTQAPVVPWYKKLWTELRDWWSK